MQKHMLNCVLAFLNTSNGFLHHRRVTLFQPQLATISAVGLLIEAEDIRVLFPMTW